MNAKHIDKIGLAMTSQSKHKTDQHAENKALFAIDCKHSNAPWELWECLNIKLGWICGFKKEPSWITGVKYRRKPNAPVWPTKQTVDMIDRLTKFMRPRSKYGHIKRGDRVLVSDGNEKPAIRLHFAEEIYGNAHCYPNGLSDFTYYKCGIIGLSMWDNCELWEGTND